MAELLIDIKVKGEQELNKLKNTIKDLEGGTISVDKAIIGLTASIAAISYAWQELTDNAQEWHEKLDKIGESTEKLTYRQGEASNAIDQLSHSIVKSVESSDLYKNAVDLLIETIDGWTSIITGKTIEAVERERKAVIAATEAIKEQEKARKANAKAMEREIELNIKHQKLLSEFEEKARREQEAIDKKIRSHNEQIAVLKELLYIYEEQGRDTTELIGKIEKLEQIDVLHTKTIREKAEAMAAAREETQKASQALDEYTDTVEEATQETERFNDAVSKGGQSNVYTVSVSGADAESEIRKNLEYAQNMALHGYNMDSYTRQQQELLARLYEEMRDLNSKVN